MMWRTTARVGRRCLMALLVGGVINFCIAEAIDLFGLVHRIDYPTERFVPVAERIICAQDMKGPGWRYLTWMSEDREGAAVSQYMYDNKLTGFEGVIGADYLHPDGPEVLPAWATCWLSENWRPDLRIPGRPYHTDIAAGWPVLSLCMDLNTPTPGKAHGGKLIRESSGGAMSLLVWRPILPGMIFGAVFWGAATAGFVAARRAWIQHRRRWCSLCPGCGYERQGIAVASPCPECGLVPTSTQA